MGEIKQFSSHGLLNDGSLERIIAAAKAEAGFWLMVKEREMEVRAMTAELARRAIDAGEIDRVFPKRLQPTISDLADELVSRIYGSYPPELRGRVEEALLEAAKIELNSDQQQASSANSERNE